MTLFKYIQYGTKDVTQVNTISHVDYCGETNKHSFTRFLKPFDQRDMLVAHFRLKDLLFSLDFVMVLVANLL